MAKIFICFYTYFCGRFGIPKTIVTDIWQLNPGRNSRTVWYGTPSFAGRTFAREYPSGSRSPNERRREAEEEFSIEIDTEILIHSTSFFSKNKERGGRTLAHIDSPLKVMYECVNKFEKKSSIGRGLYLVSISCHNTLSTRQSWGLVLEFTEMIESLSFFVLAPRILAWWVEGIFVFFICWGFVTIYRFDSSCHRFYRVAISSDCFTIIWGELVDVFSCEHTSPRLFCGKGS